VMSTAMSSHILVIDLGTNGEKLRVLRRFDHYLRNTIVHGQVVKRWKTDGDVEMGEPDAGTRDDEDEDERLMSPVVATILHLEISADGQWLATSDDHSRTHIFNLDSVQV
jgi:U3 small nucleolar RNA-associated protein 4